MNTDGRKSRYKPGNMLNVLFPKSMSHLVWQNRRENRIKGIKEIK